MNVFLRDRQVRPTLSAGELERIGERVARHLGVAPTGAGVAWVDDEEMIVWHSRFRGAATTTDVLSFPAEDAAAGDGESDGYWGDVVICTDQAARQALDLRHSYRFELVVLVVHGFLHLLGFDHTDDEGQMRTLENALRPRSLAGVTAWT